MSLPPPSLHHLDSRLNEYLRLIAEEINRLGRMTASGPGNAAPVPQPPVAPTTPAPASPSPAAPVAPVSATPLSSVRTIQAGGDSPLHVEQLLGKLAQPQIPYAPRVTVLPPLSDSHSQDGSLVVLVGTTGDMLYQFDGRVDPGSWRAVVPPVASTGSERVYLQNRFATSIIPTAGVDTVLHFNPSLLPADFNVLGKILRVYAEGIYNTVIGQTPTLQFKFKFDAITVPVDLLPFSPSLATAASVINGAWFIELFMVAFGTGTVAPVEVVGKCGITLSSTTNVATIGCNLSQPVVDLTIPHSLDFTVVMSTQAGVPPFNSLQQRLTIIELLN